MQWIDWAILVIIVISSGISLIRGFVREALSLVGWMIAFFVAKGFYMDVAALLVGQIDTPSVRLGVAWGGLFIITLTTAGFVNYIISRIVDKAGLSGMDRIMGMVFGALRGVLLVAAVTIGLRSFTPVEKDPWWINSQFIPHVEVIGGWFYEHLKETMPNIHSNFSINSHSRLLNKG